MRELWRAGQPWRDLTDDGVAVGEGPRHVAIVTEGGTRHQLDFLERSWVGTPSGGGPVVEDRWRALTMEQPPFAVLDWVAPRPPDADGRVVVTNDDIDQVLS